MIPLPRDPFLRELTISAAIPVGSYPSARALSFLLARLLARAAHRAVPALDDRLARALKRPVPYALYLIGAYVAVHRGPIQGPWMGRLDDLLFGASALPVSLALTRAYGIWDRDTIPRPPRDPGGAGGGRCGEGKLKRW